ncbi:hypothetical protein GXP76_28475, partial [Streptomyces sp. NP-1717]|nr:hypothetical protein [Streptomyces sp. NP-1717]
MAKGSSAPAAPQDTGRRRSGAEPRAGRPAAAVRASAPATADEVPADDHRETTARPAAATAGGASAPSGTAGEAPADDHREATARPAFTGRVPVLEAAPS